MMEIVKKPATPLPATREEFRAARKVEPVKTLNDYVDEICDVLYEDTEFKALGDAVYDEDAVEGSCSIDSAKQAEMIRTYAKTNGIEYVAGKKLASIVKALNVVMRRYNLSRKQRRNTLHGEVVETGDSEA